MIDIKSMTYKQLKDWIEDLGEKAFRAKQIYEWIHVKGADSFDEMTNLSKTLRTALKEQAFFDCFKTDHTSGVQN